jgi:hypothetical protein
VTVGEKPPQYDLRQEIRRGIWGAARFASFDSRGMHYFNLTAHGLWRSFAAALVSLPFFLAVAALTYRPVETVHYLNLVLGYAAVWTLFPLIMVPVMKALKLEKAYIPLIVAYNWSGVIVFGLALVTTLLYFLDNSLGPSLTLAFRIVAALYRWFVVKSAIKMGWLIPLVVIVIDEVLRTFVERGLFSLFGPIPTIASMMAQ